MPSMDAAWWRREFEDMTSLRDQAERELTRVRKLAHLFFSGCVSEFEGCGDLPDWLAAALREDPWLGDEEDDALDQS